MNIIFSLVLNLFFFAALAVLLIRFFSACAGRYDARWNTAPPREGASPDRVELFYVFLFALAFRFFVLLLSVFLVPHLAKSGADLSWIRWDALHYVNLVQLGYDGYIENGQNLFLVFFPLYVWLVRAVNLVLQNVALSGMAVSFLCYAGGCVFLYRLGTLEYGRLAARRAVIYISVFPFSFFFGGIMTEGLFFLTTAAALWYIRGHRWLLAGFWGVLAAMTRMHGVLLIVAAGAELLESRQVLAARGAELARRLFSVLKRLPLLVLPLLGTGAYLLLNYRVTGDPFSFIQQQKHWSQGFLWFSDVLLYLWRNVLTSWNTPYFWALWLPEFVLFFFFGALLLKSMRAHRSMLTIYAFLCLILNYSLSWLLSAGRYLSCAIPFFLFAAVLFEKHPLAHKLLTAAMAVLFLGYLTAYLSGAHVM